jgi:hypothetical protein
MRGKAAAVELVLSRKKAHRRKEEQEIGRVSGRITKSDLDCDLQSQLSRGDKGRENIESKTHRRQSKKYAF